MPRTNPSSPVPAVEAWWITHPKDMARGATPIASHAIDADLFAAADSLRHSAAFCDALGRATPVEAEEDHLPA